MNSKGWYLRYENPNNQYITYPEFINIQIRFNRCFTSGLSKEETIKCSVENRY